MQLGSLCYYQKAWIVVGFSFAQLALSFHRDWTSRLYKMSAKSVQGPNGKKPASAATNLIGKLRGQCMPFNGKG